MHSASFNRRYLTLLHSIIFCLLTVSAASAQQIDPNVLRGSNNNYSTVSVFDVGQGSCTFISCSNGDNVLIDCGSTQGDSNSNRIKNYIAVILPVREDVDKKTKYSLLKTLIVSHPDRDHYNLISTVLPDNVRIETIIIGGKLGQYDGSFQDWLKTQEDEKGSTVVVHANGKVIDEFSYDIEPNEKWGCYRYNDNNKNVEEGLQILGMNLPDNKPNNKSVVVKYQHGGYSTIIAGDAEKKEEDKILQMFDPNNSNPLLIDMLVGGHHGSETSTSKNWLVWCNPKYAIFSAGDHQGYRHPKNIILDRIVENKNKKLITEWNEHDVTGGIRGKDGGGWKTRKCRDAIYNTYNTGFLFSIVGVDYKKRGREGEGAKTTLNVMSQKGEGDLIYVNENINLIESSVLSNDKNNANTGTRFPFTLMDFFDLCHEQYDTPEAPNIGPLFDKLCSDKTFIFENDDDKAILTISPEPSNQVWNLRKDVPANFMNAFATLSKDGDKNIVKLYLKIPVGSGSNQEYLAAKPLVFFDKDELPEEIYVDLKGCTLTLGSLIDGLSEMMGSSKEPPSVAAPVIIKKAMNQPVNRVFPDAQLIIKFSDGVGSKMTSAQVSLSTTGNYNTCKTINGTSADLTNLDFSCGDVNTPTLKFNFFQNGVGPFPFIYPDNSFPYLNSIAYLLRCDDIPPVPPRRKPVDKIKRLTKDWIDYIAIGIAGSSAVTVSQMFAEGIPLATTAYEVLDQTKVKSVLNSTLDAIRNKPLNKDIAKITVKEFSAGVLKSSKLAKFLAGTSALGVLKALTDNDWYATANPTNTEIVALAHDLCKLGQTPFQFADALTEINLFSSIPDAAQALFSIYPDCRDTELAYAVLGAWGREKVTQNVLHSALKGCKDSEDYHKYLDCTVNAAINSKPGYIQFMGMDGGHRYVSIAGEENSSTRYVTNCLYDSGTENPQYPLCWKVTFVNGSNQSDGFMLSTDPGQYLSALTRSIEGKGECLVVSTDPTEAVILVLVLNSDGSVSVRQRDNNQFFTLDTRGYMTNFQEQLEDYPPYYQRFRPELMRFITSDPILVPADDTTPPAPPTGLIVH